MTNTETNEPIDLARIDRLDLIITHLGVMKKVFAEKIGVRKNYVSMMLSGVRPISENTAESIVSAYPEFNLIWLLHGHGEMLSGQPGNPEGEKPVTLRDIRDLLVQIDARLAALESK